MAITLGVTLQHMVRYTRTTRWLKDFLRFNYIRCVDGDLDYKQAYLSFLRVKSFERVNIALSDEQNDFQLQVDPISTIDYRS